MNYSEFYTNYSEIKFLDKIRESLNNCSAFYFSVSFIKKAGLGLILENIKTALDRGCKGKIITSTYQNFTDIPTLIEFQKLQNIYPSQFECHLEYDSFIDERNNKKGFHSKGYLFERGNNKEVLIGSSNLTYFALKKNIEWDLCSSNESTFKEVKTEFDELFIKTPKLTEELIKKYKTCLYYAIERWDMDYTSLESSIKPNNMQKKALKELNRIRNLGNNKALVCAAAGSGKTYLAAFDAFNFNPQKLLYIAQESSILNRALVTFNRVFGDEITYGLFDMSNKDIDCNFLFSTNITMANSLEHFSKQEFDYVIIDECHHATAETYKKIIKYFEPEFLLGITATPERMDGDDVLELFDQNLPYELRLRDAIINNLVVPFHYYGIRDELIEYGLEKTKSYKFTAQFTDERHCEFLCSMIEKYRKPGEKLKALAFCRDISHAACLSQTLNELGKYHTQYLTGKNSVGERIKAYEDLQNENNKLEILLTVDILNEGVDIPGVNMVLFLRPTESSTVFIQQLGRGLRKYERKEYVTVLDFIGNDYRRSVQIAFALGGLSKNFVLEKNLIKSLVKDNFEKVGLSDYGVVINIDELSKKEILEYLDKENFNSKKYLSHDYECFKKFIGSEQYPSHMEYLNNDAAPDLLRFMQSKIGGQKMYSYYNFLKHIDEIGLPTFDEQQEGFINYVSDMLPIVRPYEYMLIQQIISNGGTITLDKIKKHLCEEIKIYKDECLLHALRFMNPDYLYIQENKISIKIKLDEIFIEYMQDLLNYGLSRYYSEFGEDSDSQSFKLWKSYKKTQVRQILCKNPKDTMKGTDIEEDVVYVYVTVIKDNNVKETLKYDDGYTDENTFQWETEANIQNRDLLRLKNSKKVEVFVRKTKTDQGVTLPFTYVGAGKMNFIENSKKSNGAYLFSIPMENKATEDIYFDFKRAN